MGLLFLAGVLVPLCAPTKYVAVDPKSFRYLDPTIITNRRNAFFSLVRVFAWEFSVLSVIVLLQAVLDFATPIGVKNLLGYIETDGVDAFFKPWVWIAFFGPLLQTMASESYLYITTRQTVHATAILTEVVLDHALRIRVKAETDDKEDMKAPDTFTSSNPSPYFPVYWHGVDQSDP
ncbi:hypothetical protein F5050DRAFT_1049364 [Lentinula boryana]|uniref:ABC transmembrane type-1 domain-containing protein n=1 Tax=Lentinula boryana TaxID=40481 RepID=A0ABQ8PZK4_9AGAR|nr:hypothetical protein F5050DRAFT_1049364 [Lentinula boryana]